jgi:hypothetical protein
MISAPGGRLVDVHEVREQAHLGRREILQQVALRDERTDLRR